MLTAVCLALLAPKVLVSGWVVFWNPTSLATFEAQAAKLDEVLPEWIVCSPEGEAVRRTDYAAERKRFLTAAAAKKVAVYGMASNYSGGFSAKPVQAFLASDAKRTRHVQQMVSIAVEDGLAGIDLDYESLEAGDRDSYSTFVEELGAALRAKGKKLSIAVHAKEAEPGSWGGPQAQDWPRLGKAVDVFRVMTYDHSWATSEAGPIAPNAWVERVIRFACAFMPASKVEIGIAGYGYDWASKPAPSLTWADWGKRRRVVDPGSGEYVDGPARFSGGPAYRAKFELATKLGIRGVALWYVGSEEPTFWDSLKTSKG